MSDYNPHYDCPLCGAHKFGADRMGHHLVTDHWDTIVDAFEQGDER